MTSETHDLSRYVPRVSSEWQLSTTGPWREVEGTLCYVDISGFTALSEKLAQRGRIGAEELTEVLNHVFGRMLQVAYDRGGSLLKFGGDALLLIFRGADHPIQACSAAVEMNAALRAADHETSAGRLRLKMSVGLHGGAVHLFRVGGSHQELIVTGPAASTTTVMEETATAGEVLISPATRRSLPPDTKTRRKGPGHLLGWRKARVTETGWTPRVAVGPETIAAGVPAALRDHLDQGRVEPEHRIATVGFIKYTGVDRLLAEAGPQAVATALDQLVRNVQRAVDEEGVTFLASDIDQDGGKIIIVAGVPGVQEDDEGRVLRSARRIADHAGVLPVQIGINQGHVFVGAIGTDFRATYTIMGDTVNLAARLMAAASPGEVYASPSALDRSLTLFDTTPLRPFAVKGKAQPVQAYAVGAEAGSRPSEPRGTTRFVGRVGEMARLHSLVEGVRVGTGGVLTIVGERGVGKSRLVEEILPTLGGVDHIGIRAEPYGTATPYRALRDPVRRLLGIDRTDQETMARRLRQAVARLRPERAQWHPLIADLAMIEDASTPEVDRIDPRFRQDRTADLLMELLGELHPGPLVIEVDDGHYMDPASTHVLTRIAGATAERPWLVLTTRRDETGGFDPGGEEITLGPLGDDEARQIVLAATEAAPLRPHDVDRIVQRAGGLPLFLGEIIGAVRQSGGVDALPDSLDAVVSAQIDALPPLSRRLLQYASVLGRSFRLPTFRQLLEDENVRLDAANRRELAGFLDEADSDRLRFRHAVIRDAAYASLSFRRRRELHLRAGTTVERASGPHPEEQAAVLALHFSRGDDHRRAWRYARMAADHARDASANPEAATQYRRAIESARRLGDIADLDLAEVWTALGDVSERAGRYEESLDAYRLATRLVGDDRYQRADLLVRRAVVRRLSGAYSAALRETALGLKLVALDMTAAGTRARARLTVERSAIRSSQERAAEALRLAEEAERDAREAGDPETLAKAFYVIDWAHRMMGAVDIDVRYAEALDIFEQLGDMSGVALVSNNLGAEAYYRGRWSDAIDAYHRSRKAELQNGNDVQAAIPAANVAEVLINQGRLDEAEPLLHDAIRVLTASGHSAAGFAKSELARLLIRRGDHEAAAPLLAQIRERGQATDEPADVLISTLLLADSKLCQGATEEGLAILEDAANEAGEMADLFGPVIARLRSLGLAATGRVDEALGQIEQGLTWAQRQGLLYDQALLLDARTRIVSSEGGTPDPEDVREADRLYGELGIRREPALAVE